MKKYLMFIILLSPVICIGQEQDLLRDLADSTIKTQAVTGAFKSTRVIMSQSVELLKSGVLDFRILHRFGNVNQGISELFGLDQATIRLGLDYGITDNFTVGIGRGSLDKEVDGFLKWRPLQQSVGNRNFPLSLVVVAGTTMVGTSWKNLTPKRSFEHRLAYYFQTIIGRKFNDKFTLQLSPTFLHRNLVENVSIKNNLFATGIGGRMKLSKRVSINVDYFLVTDKPPASLFHNPLSVGFDIETGGHVFQLHFTNAIGMNEKVFLTETTNDWLNGDIQFGFNISRSFQIRKRKLR
jgi:hypothetical protein